MVIFLTLVCIPFRQIYEEGNIILYYFLSFCQLLLSFLLIFDFHKSEFLQTAQSITSPNSVKESFLYVSNFFFLIFYYFLLFAFFDKIPLFDIDLYYHNTSIEAFHSPSSGIMVPYSTITLYHCRYTFLVVNNIHSMIKLQRGTRCCVVHRSKHII